MLPGQPAEGTGMGCSKNQSAFRPKSIGDVGISAGKHWGYGLVKVNRIFKKQY